MNDEYKERFKQYLVSRGVRPEWITEDNHDLRVCVPNTKTITYTVQINPSCNTLRLELWSNVEEKEKGWWLETKAKHLVMFYSDTEFYTLELSCIDSFLQRGAKYLSKETSSCNANTFVTKRFITIDLDQEIVQDIYIEGKWTKRTTKLTPKHHKI